jgi:hypothetical protein
MEGNKITTIKLSAETKKRLDHLKIYRRETYEEILQKIFQILNLCKVNPERARGRLISIDRQKKRMSREAKESKL